MILAKKHPEILMELNALCFKPYVNIIYTTRLHKVMESVVQFFVCQFLFLKTAISV